MRDLSLAKTEKLTKSVHNLSFIAYFLLYRNISVKKSLYILASYYTCYFADSLTGTSDKGVLKDSQKKNNDMPYVWRRRCVVIFRRQNNTAWQESRGGTKVLLILI